MTTTHQRQAHKTRIKNFHKEVDFQDHRPPSNSVLTSFLRGKTHSLSQSVFEASCQEVTRDNLGALRGQEKQSQDLFLDAFVLPPP